MTPPPAARSEPVLPAGAADGTRDGAADGTRTSVARPGAASGIRAADGAAPPEAVPGIPAADADGPRDAARGIRVPAAPPGTVVPPAVPGSAGLPGAGGREEDDAPGLALQLSALQAMCRQVFGFRIAMVAVASPIAVLRAGPGLDTWMVGSAVLVTFMGSYMLFRDWERFGPVLLRHPLLLAGDTLFAALLLAASPDSPLAYPAACTPFLAGLVYGRKGAAFFTVLQGLLLLLIVSLDPSVRVNAANSLLLPGFYVVAGITGSALRGLLLRFGEATHALTETRARLAVTEERARLARDMHDTVAKTLHGLALAADGLAAAPERAGEHAEVVALAARRAAAESRELLEGLRRAPGAPATTPPLTAALAALAAGFTSRTGVPVRFEPPERPVPALDPGTSAQLVAVAAEALENVARHAGAARAGVEVRPVPGGLVLTVTDDGTGFPEGTTLESLRRSGRFGIVGMAERSAGAGAAFSVGPGPGGTGTEVRLMLPLPSAPAGPGGPS